MPDPTATPAWTPEVAAEWASLMKAAPEHEADEDGRKYYLLVEGSVVRAAAARLDALDDGIQQIYDILSARADCCPICYSSNFSAHAPDCWLAPLLAPSTLEETP